VINDVFKLIYKHKVEAAAAPLQQHRQHHQLKHQHQQK